MGLLAESLSRCLSRPVGWRGAKLGALAAAAVIAPASSGSSSEGGWREGPPLPPPTGLWTLAFSDGFGDGRLDTTKWDWRYPRSRDRIYSNRANGEAQWYRRANVEERHGHLRLVARRQRTVSPFTGRSFRFTSGLVQSKPSFNFRHGYMEARVKLPRGSGFWPAFWTWPSNEQWPPEIDVVEFHGDNPRRAYLTYHGRDGATRSVVTSRDWTADWHTFGVEWGRDRLTWYVDGTARKVVNEAPALKMYLIANLAIANGEGAPAPTSRTPFPSALKIDYIRVWRPLLRFPSFADAIGSGP